MNSIKVKEHIVRWLYDYVKTSGVKGMVIGISGGIDSAVVSTLCAETGLPTLCIELPIHQAENQVQRAKKHIQFLKDKYPNVSDLTINLTSVFDEFVKQIPEAENNALALANTRARFRMSTLYYFAGLQGFIVVGTGNKIEDFGVGFFTKYGDGGVDISPIADLMKSEVYQLAQILNISLDIQDQLGATYDELEWAMLATEQGKKPIDYEGREKQVIAIYQRLNKINQHKMTPIPICIIPTELKN